MNDPNRDDLNENLTTESFSGAENVHAGRSDDYQNKTGHRRLSDIRPVSPTFLQALGLIKLATEETPTTRLQLSKTHVTESDSIIGGCETSPSKELILPFKKRHHSVAASNATKKTSVTKKKRIPKLKIRIKKRTHSSSDDEFTNLNVLRAKKLQKTAAPDADKPSKEVGQDVTSQQPVPQAKTVEPTPSTSTGKTAEDSFESNLTADKFRLWVDIIESDFQSLEFTKLLKSKKFTENQTIAVQRSFQQLCQKFCSKPMIIQDYMKTYKCTECNFSISHECVAINSSDTTQCIEYITPESMTMCDCNFTTFHSHAAKLKSKGKRAESPPPLLKTTTSTLLPMIENDRSVRMDCRKCCINIVLKNQKSDVCSQLKNFISTDVPIRKKFYRYVNKHLDHKPKDSPLLNEFYSCNNLCCMLFHRCDRDILDRNTTPVRRHQLLSFHTTGEMGSV